MYEELDYLHDDDNYSTESNQGKIKNMITNNSYQRLFQIVRKTPNGKQKKIKIFVSGPIGFRIRNAITGEKSNSYLVGSSNEDLYFKVVNSTGELGQESQTLFYDSPEQFEKHMFTTVSQTIKEKWNEKYMAAKYKIYSKK
jgi:hypothetical protein